MRRANELIVILLTCAIAIASIALPASGKEYVDLELILAVDISRSMDADEQRLQRDGYVQAFRDAGIVKAIQSGPNGRIAVAYVEWAGEAVQQIVIPWRVIRSPGDAARFADELAAKPTGRARMTSISEALVASSRLFAASPTQGLRRVIDVSGDGPNNSGRPVELARDQVVAAGIVINGLAISLKRDFGAYSFFDLTDLDRYYKDCVIGGPGSFVLLIQNKSEFATAIRQKLLLEIAGLNPAGSRRLRRVQYLPPTGVIPNAKYDCLIGEKRWQQYRGGDDQW